MTEFRTPDGGTEQQEDVERLPHVSYPAAGLGPAAVEGPLERVRAGIGDRTVAGIPDAGTRAGHVSVADRLRLARGP